MRIAVLTNSYPPDSRGGSGQIAKLQVDWLTSHGHDVRVWVPDPFVETSNKIIQDFKPQTTIPYPRLGNHNPLYRLVFHFEDLAPNAELVESIRNFQPDVLLSHNLTGCGWGTPETLKKAGVRWIHILHDVQMTEPSGQIQAQESISTLRSAWRNYWAKKRSKAFGSPDKVISPSSWLLTYHKQFQLFKDSNTSVIPNPIPTTNFEQRTANIDTNNVLYVGRVAKDKGVEVLINAWQSLISKPGKLKIIGSGPYLDTVKQLNDPTIECLGALDHSELAKHYAEASLFVFPSLLMENQPTVLLEAVSHGLNIIASDIGGVGELLQGYGALIPPGEPNQLASAITEQINKKPDPVKCQEILSRHGIDKVMEKLLKNLSP
jgi:glycosyltransferase involved in cell wall biosynthesis